MIGTETWLDPSIPDNQILPPYFKIYRIDRPSKGGGVIIAIRHEFLSSPVPELETKCEIIWAKLQLVGQKCFYICSYYNPKTSNAGNKS